jgi:hypothetical protein
MDPINAALIAIESLEPGEDFSYKYFAKRFGVVDSTLRRRHQGITQARTITNTSRRLLNPQQEKEFLQYLTCLTEHSTPPTRQIMQSFASTIAQKDVSLQQIDRFIERHCDSLVSQWTTGIDSNHHNASLRVKYEAYFNLLHGQIAEYGVEP